MVQLMNFVTNHRDVTFFGQQVNPLVLVYRCIFSCDLLLPKKSVYIIAAKASMAACRSAGGQPVVIGPTLDRRRSNP
jgi:hypothetical protein